MTIEWIAKLSGFISFLSSDWLPDEKSNQELPKWISYLFFVPTRRSTRQTSSVTVIGPGSRS
jgi:hypothetical protein